MNPIEEDQVLVAGFAQLPKGTPVFEMKKSIGCVLVVDRDTAIIKKATFTFIQDLTNDFISSMLVGNSLVKDVNNIVEEVEKRFLVPPQKAIIQSIISARNRFKESLITEE